MKRIQSDKEYRKTMKRIEELFFETDENTQPEDSRLLELDVLSEMVEDYERLHFPIDKPTPSEELVLSL